MFLFFGTSTNKILGNFNLSQLQHDSYRYFGILRSRKKNKKVSSDYVINLALQADQYEVLKVMQEAFYPDEPTCAALGVRANPIMEERTRQFLREGMSLVARCKYDNCIVGAAVNCSVQSWNPDLTENLACSSKKENVRTLLLFYAYVTRVGDLWSCYNTKNIFETAYLFVKPEHRRKGISTSLLERSLTLGADCGFSIARYDATNYKTALICQKLGMQLYDAIPYCSYLGRNYEPIFRPAYPNESVKIFIKPFRPLNVEPESE